MRKKLPLDTLERARGSVEVGFGGVEPSWPAGRRRPSRAGFTLLEVLLASVIGVLLMAALYAAVDIQLRHAQAARDIVEQGTLARALLERMAGDINTSLAPSLPPTGGGLSGSSTSGATGGSSALSSTPSTSSGAASTASPTTTPSPSSTAGNTVVFNLGVQGDAGRLTLYVSQLPRELNLPPAILNSQPLPLVSDLRRITYWLAGGGDRPLGLARQEIKLVTSDDLMSAVPPGLPDEPSYVVAEEVKSLAFSYFDGNTWQDSWDGTTAGLDGATPIGPPVAIAIVVGIAAPGVDNPEGPADLKSYRHVVFIPTANGAVQQQTTTTAGQ